MYHVSFMAVSAQCSITSPPVYIHPMYHCLETDRLIPEGAVDPKYIEESMETPDTGSFMHLHLGIDAKGLDDLDIHYSVRRRMW